MDDVVDGDVVEIRRETYQRGGYSFAAMASRDEYHVDTRPRYFVSNWLHHPMYRIVSYVKQTPNIPNS